MPKEFDKLSWPECLEDSIETLLRKVLQELREMREESQADKREIESLKAQLVLADPYGVAKDILEGRASLNQLRAAALGEILHGHPVPIDRA